MVIFIIQILLLVFTSYVFTPLFSGLDVGGVFKFIALAPFGFGTLIFGLIFSITGLISGLICRRKIKSAVNFILLIMNLIIGLVFIL